MLMPIESDKDREEGESKRRGRGGNLLLQSDYAKLQKKMRQLDQQIAQNRAREEELVQMQKNQLVVHDLLKLSLEDISLDALLNRALEKIVTLNWVITGAFAHIFLLDDKTQTLVLRASKGYVACSTTPCRKVAVGECMCGLAAQTGEMQFASEVDERHTIHGKGIAPHGHYCVPIQIARQTVGVFALYLPAGHPFDKNEESTLTSISTTLAGIIQRDRITAKKKNFKHLLHQAQKVESLGTLCGGIAHDFNNLLAPILGYAELSLRALEPGSRVEPKIQEIIKAAKKASLLIKQVLLLSHKGDSSPELTLLSLDRVIQETYPLIRASIPATIEIQQDIVIPDCPVLAEETALCQILLNLCINAYHALPGTGGTITLGLRQIQLQKTDFKLCSMGLSEGKYLVLEVSDNGCGIAPELQPRIFDPYFTTKKQGEGTGLGLAIVHGIVKSYGGIISLDSELGEGSCFKIYLPAQQQQPSAARVACSESPRGHERILVVDDEAPVAAMTSRTLSTLGYRTTYFTSGSEALEAFQLDPNLFDLVITDMTMPQMSGLELLKKLRRIRPDLPIISCTGFSELSNEQKTRTGGFQRCLTKPVPMYDLAKAVRATLDNP